MNEYRLVVWNLQNNKRRPSPKIVNEQTNFHRNDIFDTARQYWKHRKKLKELNFILKVGNTTLANDQSF